MFFVNIPIYGNFTKVIYFPSRNLKSGGNFVLYTKELKPLVHSGNFISVPYHFGYDYAVFPSLDSGVVTAVYQDFPPDAIKYFKYEVLFPEKPEVQDYEDN